MPRLELQFSRNHLGLLHAMVHDPARPSSTPSKPFPVVIDTGTSMSVIPRAIVEAFVQRGQVLANGLPVNVTFGNGARDTVPTVIVDIEVEDRNGTKWTAQVSKGHADDGVMVLPRRNILIGMDIVSLWRVTIDGPNSVAFADMPPA